MFSYELNKVGLKINLFVGILFGYHTYTVLSILHTCKHSALESTSRCLKCERVCTLGGRVMAGRGVPAYEPEHLPRLMRCSPAPLQGQGGSSELSHFPMGQQTGLEANCR